MNNYLGYDETDPISIEEYGKRLIGKTFADVCRDDENSKIDAIREDKNYVASHEDRNRKGGLGQIIEERYFHYPANSEAKPDFAKAGVELKVTPFKINKDHSITAKERLILTMIDYCTVVDEKFETSHMWEKSRLILLVYYLYQENLKSRLDYRIHYVNLFTPPKQDLQIIKKDYEYIVNKIKEGKAHELSEADTLYLGAASKAGTSKDRRKQPYSSIMAKPRAFAFKNSYMTYVLNNYILPGQKTYEPIVKNEDIEDTFEEFVKKKINHYENYSVKELCDALDIPLTSSAKNLESRIVFDILGVSGNKAEEFVKANIVVKTIRIETNNKIKESMSFPVFKFKELIKEEWEESTFGNYLRETKFFFVVYKYDDNGTLRLKGCQFWNMPYDDLEIEVKSVWEKTKSVIENGLKISVSNKGRTTNLPKRSENPVCHVRPHGKNSADTYELPDGRHFTKQCFWLNNTYIAAQLDKRFFA